MANQTFNAIIGIANRRSAPLWSMGSMESTAWRARQSTVAIIRMSR
jgi:hypothetical protein